jgi:hypothetical protein
MIKSNKSILALCGILLATHLPAFAADQSAETGRWIPLFNGKNLDGWTVKITKHPLGENFGDTYRVEDGILKVAYDQYAKFDGQFGHLYSNNAYSHYILRLEYRFTGTKMPDAPVWTNLNSGVMIHTQSPLSLILDQSFPVSMEVQFLADEGKGPRPTGNMCSPGTNIEIDGQLVTQHIVKSTSPTFPPEEWVKVEVEVHGNREVIHRINGQEVLRYQRPQLDPNDGDPQRQAVVRQLLAAGVNLQLDSGHLALQAEGHPVWFRHIELLPLEKP